MREFDKLTEVVEKLLSPEGCQWDREQTLQSLRPYLIEEIYEIIEAIDLDDNAKIFEEVGDVFFHLVFICKLAQRDNRFELKDALEEITEKLIRRHPHVFGSMKLESVDEVIEQWEAIKRLEKGKSCRKSVLDDIPKGLPVLAKAQKMIAKLNKTDFADSNASVQTPLLDFEDEDQLGILLYDIAKQAEVKGLNAKHALLKKITHVEKQFREWEEASAKDI